MSKAVYLARVIKTEDGWYAIDFPDLPGTHAQCKALEDVQREAEDALCSFLLAAQAVGEDVPVPSGLLSHHWRSRFLLRTVYTGSLYLKDDETVVRITADLETCK